MPAYRLGHDSDVLSQGAPPGQGQVLVRYSRSVLALFPKPTLFACLLWWLLPACPGMEAARETRARGYFGHIVLGLWGVFSTDF